MSASSGSYLPRHCTSCGAKFTPHGGTYGLRCPNCGWGQENMGTEILGCKTCSRTWNTDDYGRRCPNCGRPGAVTQILPTKPPPLPQDAMLERVERAEKELVVARRTVAASQRAVERMLEDRRANIATQIFAALITGKADVSIDSRELATEAVAHADHLLDALAGDTNV